MRNTFFARTALASVATFAFLGPLQVMADCLSVKGKILNTLQDPALGNTYIQGFGSVGGVSTTGVVALNGEGSIGKLKCALVGVAVGEGEPSGFPPPLPPFLPNFTHTISCDDQVEGYGGTIHSQLTFDTTGKFTGFDGGVILSFIEHSVPRAESGTGVFVGTTGGSLTIEGTSNIVTKSIDMEFTGQVCTNLVR